MDARISLANATWRDKTSPPLLPPPDSLFDCANIVEGLFAVQLQCLAGLISHREAEEEEAHLNIIFSNILFPNSIGLVCIQRIKKTFSLTCPDYHAIETALCDCPVLPVIYHCATQLSINIFLYLY